MVTAQLPENSKFLRLADGHGRRCAYPETKRNPHWRTETI